MARCALAVSTLLLEFAGVAASSFGQPFDLQSTFERDDSEDGMSNNVVSAILQDSDGFLWIGTDDC